MNTCQQKNMVWLNHWKYKYDRNQHIPRINFNHGFSSHEIKNSENLTYVYLQI